MNSALLNAVRLRQRELPRRAYIRNMLASYSSARFVHSMSTKDPSAPPTHPAAQVTRRPGRSMHAVVMRGVSSLVAKPACLPGSCWIWLTFEIKGLDAGRSIFPIGACLVFLNLNRFG